MMFDFTKLWDKLYLFGPNPLEMSRSDWGLLWLAGGFVLIGIGAKILAVSAATNSPRKVLGNRFFHLFATVGFFLLLWAGARFENIPWISTHLTALLLLILWLVWFSFIAKYFFFGFRSQTKQWEEEERKRKYLNLGKK